MCGGGVGGRKSSGSWKIAKDGDPGGEDCAESVIAVKSPSIFGRCRFGGKVTWRFCLFLFSFFFGDDGGVFQNAKGDAIGPAIRLGYSAVFSASCSFLTQHQNSATFKMPVCSITADAGPYGEANGNQLIMICGLPSSGKTTRAKQIKKFFEDRIAAAKANPEGPDDQRIARYKVHYFSDDTLGLDKEMYRGASQLTLSW